MFGGTDGLCSSLLVKHQGSQSHISAMAANGSHGAPTYSQSEKVLKSPSIHHEDIGNKKQIVMIWCLSEAKLDMERLLAETVHTSLISQDAAGGKLFVRASVSSSLWKSDRFIIGYGEQAGTDAVAIPKNDRRVGREVGYTTTGPAHVGSDAV